MFVCDASNAHASFQIDDVNSKTRALINVEAARPSMLQLNFAMERDSKLITTRMMTTKKGTIRAAGSSIQGAHSVFGGPF